MDFYPRSPCGERLSEAQTSAVLIPFLSTLSLRRATATLPGRCRWEGISIHALLAESDPAGRSRCRRKRYFYPRSPCGERLRCSATHAGSSPFLSTLSLRRATKCGCPIPAVPRNFYPRSPCGERQPKRRGLSKYYDISIHALLAESDVGVETSTALAL